MSNAAYLTRSQAEETYLMTNEISWQVELAVKPGKLEDFRALTREMVESTRDEPGVLIYERFVSDDGQVVYVHDRYADSSSAVSHLLAFGKKYRERFCGHGRTKTVHGLRCPK